MGNDYRIVVERLKADGVLMVVMQIPSQLPTEKQCLFLLEILDKDRLEGMVLTP
ncbi:hypothetical protein [Nitrosomonas sp. ANs5]|uniref:hypothetical protein n=1 Tax=Nitrosomonas sp. ANs5 TaxID=3423941 RepID=UPI003D337535